MRQRGEGTHDGSDLRRHGWAKGRGNGAAGKRAAAQERRQAKKGRRAELDARRVARVERTSDLSTRELVLSDEMEQRFHTVSRSSTAQNTDQEKHDESERGGLAVKPFTSVEPASLAGQAFTICMDVRLNQRVLRHACESGRRNSRYIASRSWSSNCRRLPDLTAARSPALRPPGHARLCLAASR